MGEDIDHVRKDNILYALIISGSFEIEKGVRFYPNDQNFLQIGLMGYDKGHKLKPHMHKSTKLVIDAIQEVLYIKRGKVRVDIYDESKNVICTRVLEKGDLILLIRGGHSFEMIEDSQIIEIKQGPYLGQENDKEYFEQGKDE